MCLYGDKDVRCGFMMWFNKKFYCENYGFICCEFCFKIDCRLEVIILFFLFISVRRLNIVVVNRVRS